jgi:hypothetical protein
LSIGHDFNAFQSHLKTLGFEIIQPRSKNEIIFFHRLFQKNRKDLIQLIPDAPAAAALLSSLPVAPTFNNVNPNLNGLMAGSASSDPNGSVSQQQAAFQQLQQLQLSLMQAQLSSYANHIQNAGGNANGTGNGNSSSTSDSSSSSTNGFGGYPLPADPMTGFNQWPGFSPGFFNQINPWLLSMQVPYASLSKQTQQQQGSEIGATSFPSDSLLLSNQNLSLSSTANFSLPSLASLTMGSTINGSSFLPSYLLSSYNSNPLLQNTNTTTHQAFLHRKLQQVSSSIFKDGNVFHDDDSLTEKNRRKISAGRRKSTSAVPDSDDEREAVTSNGNKRKRGKLSSKPDLRNIPSTVLSHSLIKSSLLMQQQQPQPSDDESLQSIDDDEVNRRQLRSRSKRSRKPITNRESSRGRSDDDSVGPVTIIRKRSSEPSSSNRSMLHRERSSDYPTTRSSYSSSSAVAVSTSSLSSKAVAEDILDLRKVNNKRLFIDFTISHHPPSSKSQSDEITQQQNENIALLEKENNYVYGYFYGKLINNEECTSYRFASQGHSEYLPLPVPIPTTSTRSRGGPRGSASSSAISSRVGPSYQAEIPQCLSRKSIQKTSNLLEDRWWAPSMIDEEDLTSLVRNVLNKKKEWLPTVGNIYTVILSDVYSMKYKLCAIIEVNPVLLKKPNKKIRERCYVIKVYDGEEEYIVPVENIVRALHMEDEEFLDVVHQNDYDTDNVTNFWHILALFLIFCVFSCLSSRISSFFFAFRS